MTSNVEMDETDDITHSVPDNIASTDVQDNQVEVVPAEVSPVVKEVEDGNESAPTDASSGNMEEPCSKADRCKDPDEHDCIDDANAEECQPLESPLQDKSLVTAVKNTPNSEDNNTEMMEKTCGTSSDDSEDSIRKSKTKEVGVAHVTVGCLVSIVDGGIPVGSAHERRNTDDEDKVNNDFSHDLARNLTLEGQLVSNEHADGSEFQIIQGCLNHVLSMVVDNCAEDTTTEQNGKHPAVNLASNDESCTGYDANTMGEGQEGASIQSAQSVLNSGQYEACIGFTKSPEKQKFDLAEHDMKPTAIKDVHENQKEMECQDEDCQLDIGQKEINSMKIGAVVETSGTASSISADLSTSEANSDIFMTTEEFEEQKTQSVVVKPLQQCNTGISDTTEKEDGTSSNLQAIQKNRKAPGLEKGRISIGYSKRKDKYKCFLCGDVGTGRKFEEHVMLHLLWKPYKCLYCSQFFINRASIGTHVSENHTGQLPKCGLRAIKKAKQFLAEARKKGTCEYLSQRLNDMYWTCIQKKKSGRKSGMEDFEEDKDDSDSKSVTCEGVELPSELVLPDVSITSPSQGTSCEQNLKSNETVTANEIQPRSDDFTIKTSPSTSTIHAKSNEPIDPIILPDADDSEPLELPEKKTNPTMSPVQRTQISYLNKMNDPIIVPDTDDIPSLESPEKKTNEMTYPLLMEQINDPTTPIILPDMDDIATSESEVKKTNRLVSQKEQSSHASERVAKVVPTQRDRPCLIPITTSCVIVQNLPTSTIVTSQSNTNIPGTNLFTGQQILHQVPLVHPQTTTFPFPSTSVLPILPRPQLTSASQITIPAQQLTNAFQILSAPRQLTSASQILSPRQQLTTASQILTPVPVLTTPVLPPPRVSKSIPVCNYIILSGNSLINMLPSSTLAQNVPLQTSHTNLTLLQPRQDSTVQTVAVTSGVQATVSVNQRSPPILANSSTDSINEEESRVRQTYRKEVYHPKKFSIFMMNNHFMCNLCKKKYTQESTFRAHLWNHLHISKFLCSCCSSSISGKGWKTLSCSKTEDYIMKLKMSGVSQSSVVEVEWDDEDNNGKQAIAHIQQQSMTEQQTALASVNKPEIPVDKENSMGSIATTGKMAGQTSRNEVGDDVCQQGTSEKTIAECILLSEGGHSARKREQSDDGSGNAREVMSENTSLLDVVTGAISVTSTQAELPIEMPPTQETVSQCKNLDPLRSEKMVGSTISQDRSSTDAAKPKFYVCGAACGYSTLFGSELKKHVEECKLQGALLCSHCKFKADCPDVLVRHMGKHYLAHLPGIAVFQCSMPKCNFATNILQGFVHHTRNLHANLDSYTCHFCGECFTEPMPLLKHLHSNILHVVNCKYCTAKDCNKAVIMKHIGESHPEKSKVTNMVKQLLCKDRKENVSASRLLLDVNATPTSHTTSSDDSRASRFSDINHPLPRSHAQFHVTGSNKPTTPSAFVQTEGNVANTPIIDRTTSLAAKQISEGQKVSHPYGDGQEVTCFSEKSLSCQVCSFIAKTESELNVHTSKHKANPSPRMLSYSCPECPEDFNMIDSFQTHLRKHNKEIHYDICSCQICQMEKGSRQNVLNHIKAVHNPIGDGHEFVQCVFKISNSDVVTCSSCTYMCVGTEAMLIHRQKQTCCQRPTSNLGTEAVPTQQEQSCTPGRETAAESHDKTSNRPTSLLVATFHEDIALSGNHKTPKVTMVIPSNSVYKYPVRCCICTYSSVYKANLKRHMDKNHPEVCVIMEDRDIASPTKARHVPRHVPDDVSDFQESDVDKLKIGGSFLDKELEWLYEDHGSVYRCLKCHKNFHRKNIIHAHVLSHWDISLWKCPTCSYKHARRVMVMEHMKQEHNKDCNMDDIEPLVDSLRNDISSIVGTLVEKGKIVNDMAPILGSKYLDLKFRNMYKTVGKKRLCKICEAEYQSTYDMHRHILKMHLELTLFKCKYCSFSSIDRLSVVEHISNEHPQEIVIVCYIPCTTHKIKMKRKKVTQSRSSKASEIGSQFSEGSKETSVKKIADNKNKTKTKNPSADFGSQSDQPDKNVGSQSDQPEKNVTRTNESDNDFCKENTSQLGKASAPSPSSSMSKTARDSRDGRHELRVGSNTLDQKLNKLYNGKSSKSQKMVCNVCKQDFPSKYSLHCHLLAHLKINLLACPYCNFEQVEKSKVFGHIKSNHPNDHLHLRHIEVDIDETVKEFIGDRNTFGRKKKAHKEIRLSHILAGRTSMKSPSKLSKSPEKQSRNVVAVKIGELRKYKCRLCDYMALTKNSVVGHVFKVHEKHQMKSISDELSNKKGKGIPTLKNKKGKVVSPQTSKKSAIDKNDSACIDSQFHNHEKLESSKSTDTSDSESTHSSGIKEKRKDDSHPKKPNLEEADLSAPFRCPKCSFADSWKNNVLSHMKSKHSVTNVLSCNYCDAWFFTEDSLKGHISFLHKGKAIKYKDMLLEDVASETLSKDSSKSTVKRRMSDDGQSAKDSAKRAKKSSKALFTSKDETKSNSKAVSASIIKPSKQVLLETANINSAANEKHCSSEDVHVKSECIEKDCVSLKAKDAKSFSPSKTNPNTPLKDTLCGSAEQTVAWDPELSSCVPSSPENSADEQTEFYKYLCVYCEFKINSTLEMKYHIAGHQTERIFSGQVPENEKDKAKIKKKVSAILPICKERAKNKLINVSSSQVSNESEKPNAACEVTPIKSTADSSARDGPFLQKSPPISASQSITSRNRLSLKRKHDSSVATEMQLKHHKNVESNCSSDSSSESEDSETIQPRKIRTIRLIVSSDEENSDDEDERSATPEKKLPSPSKINYCCHLCPFMGRSLYQFRSHLTSHGGFAYMNPDISKESMLTCGFCGFMAESKDNFTDHVEKHLSGGIYKCGYCKFDSYHRKNMKSHLNCKHRHKPEKFVDLRILMRERAQRPGGTASLVNLDPQLRLVDSMTSLEFKRLLDEAGCETMSMPLSVVKVVYQLIGGNIEGISEDELDM